MADDLSKQNGDNSPNIPPNGGSQNSGASGDEDLNLTGHTRVIPDYKSLKMKFITEKPAPPPAPPRDSLDEYQRARLEFEANTTQIMLSVQTELAELRKARLSSPMMPDHMSQNYYQSPHYPNQARSQNYYQSPRFAHDPDQTPPYGVLAERPASSYDQRGIEML